MSSRLNKSVVYFVTEDWYFFSHRLGLAKKAIEHGFSASVITKTNKHGDVIKESGLDLLPLDIKRNSLNPLREFLVIFRVLRYYYNKKPDIVHQVALKPVIYGTITAKLSRVPVIINAFAGLGIIFSTNKKSALFIQWFIKLFLRFLLQNTFLIVQNQSDFSVLQQIGLKNIYLIKGAGVDIDTYISSPEPDSIPLVILPARLLWTKGVGLFVEASAELKQRGVKARFALVGQPDELNPSSVSESQLKHWESQGLVELWGQRNDMPEVFAQCNIVCLPTKYGEGIPKSLIEAAACERAIITSNRPGCADIVKDKVNGYLINPDNLGDLVEKLQDLITDASLRKAMGIQGRIRVIEQFSSEKIYAETIGLYEKLRQEKNLAQ